MSTERIQTLIRDVPDFPKPGIMFKDITPLLADSGAFAETIAKLAAMVAKTKPHAIAAIESRGFIFGAPVAAKLGLPLELVRKPGKLPARKVGLDYDLEYGSDRVEMHADAILRGQRYALVDDLIATGGTAAAAAQLIEQQGAHVVSCSFVIELSFLNGRKLLGDYPVDALVTY